MREKMFRAWVGGGWYYFRIGDGLAETAHALYNLACHDGVEWYECMDKKDKLNGKIFEGNICNIRRRYSKKWEIGEIICCHRFEDGFHVRCYWGKKSVSDYYGVRFCEIGEIEIIGNIHEHPELLEEST